MSIAIMCRRGKVLEKNAFFKRLNGKYRRDTQNKYNGNDVEKIS